MNKCNKARAENGQVFPRLKLSSQTGQTGQSDRAKCALIVPIGEIGAACDEHLGCLSLGIIAW